GRLVASFLKLRDAPLQAFQIFLRLGILAGRHGLGSASRLHLAMARKRVEQHQQRAHRADHGIQKGEHLDAARRLVLSHATNWPGAKRERARREAMGAAWPRPSLKSA